MVKRKFRPIAVLVKTLYDSNIGASSRALANMGSDELILISPQCEITYSAQLAAATGQTALQNRREYSSWDEFYLKEKSGLRIAFSARDGKGRMVQDFATTLNEISQKDPSWQDSSEPEIPVYLIFGPEDAGLAAADLDQAHACVSIPTFGKNPSLNLAQAVLLGFFILRTTWGGEAFEYQERGKDCSWVEEVGAFPDQSLKTFLEAMGFSLDNPKTNVYTVFRRMLMRTVPTVKELRMLEIIFQQGARKMRIAKDFETSILEND